jgi:integrase
MVGDKSAANEVASKIEAKLKLGEFDFGQEKPIPSLREYAESYLNRFSKTNHKYSTNTSLKSVLRKHLFPAFGDTPLDKITRKDIKDFIHTKKGRYADNTVRNILVSLSGIFTQAMDDEVIEKNPASKLGKTIKTKKKDEHGNEILEENENGRPPSFEWDELQSILNALRKDGHDYFPFFLTLARTGVRIGEGFALTPSDLDFERSVVKIERSLVRNRLTTPKNGKSRAVDMSEQLAIVLKRHLKKRAEDILKNGWEKDKVPLFYTINGEPIKANYSLRKKFNKYLKKAGIEGHHTLHNFRHTWISLRVNKGDNLVDVMKQAGHSDIKTTLRYLDFKEGNYKHEVNELDLPVAPKRTLSAP